MVLLETVATQQLDGQRIARILGAEIAKTNIAECLCFDGLLQQPSRSFLLQFLPNLDHRGKFFVSPPKTPHISYDIIIRTPAESRIVTRIVAEGGCADGNDGRRDDLSAGVDCWASDVEVAGRGTMWRPSYARVSMGGERHRSLRKRMIAP